MLRPASGPRLKPERGIVITGAFEARIACMLGSSGNRFQRLSCGDFRVSRELTRNLITGVCSSGEEIVPITGFEKDAREKLRSPDGIEDASHQDALLKTGALQDAIFNSAYFSSIATDAKGVIQIFNVGAEHLLGYAASDVVNKITPASLSDPQELIARAAALTLEFGTPISPGFEALAFKAARGIEDIYELTKIRKDGSRFPAIVSVTALRDTQDGIIGYLLIATDNTARKQVEAIQEVLNQRVSNTILEQKVLARTVDLQRLRTALDATADVLTLVNRRTMTYVEVNAAACHLFGYTREELLQMGPEDLAVGTREEMERAYDLIIAGHGTKQPSEAWVRCKDGTKIQVEVNRQAMQTGTDWTIVSVSRDVTERKLAEAKLHQLAYYDPLTGLPNRRLFQESLQKTMAQAADLRQQVVLLYLDLDHFKDINDSLGHAFGDELLRQVGARLIGCLYPRDTVGRLGGDEFGVVLLTPGDARIGLIVANKIHAAMQAPFEVAGHPVNVRLSIGITIYPIDSTDLDSLARYADLAMYEAKQAGRNTSRYYTKAMNQRVNARVELESALGDALTRKEFVLHYQPKVCLRTGRWRGVEALLRWKRPGHGLVLPTTFISALEDTNLVIPVGFWVIATACRQLADWARDGIGPVPIAVNVSALQISRKHSMVRAAQPDGDEAVGTDGIELLAATIDCLKQHNIPPGLLEMEITESAVMADAEHNIETLRKLKAMGIRLSVDDFGTGYSSLAYLRRFPLDTLKIDGSFIRDIATSTEDASIIIAIIEIAHRLNLNVVAECVESAEQVKFLRANGCDEAQGYYFAQPMPAEELARLWQATEGVWVDIALTDDAQDHGLNAAM